MPPIAAELLRGSETTRWVICGLSAVKSAPVSISAQRRPVDARFHGGEVTVQASDHGIQLLQVSGKPIEKSIA
jgi:hypothetical protein